MFARASMIFDTAYAAFLILDESPRAFIIAPAPHFCRRFIAEYSPPAANICGHMMICAAIFFGHYYDASFMHNALPSAEATTKASRILGHGTNAHIVISRYRFLEMKYCFILCWRFQLREATILLSHDIAAICDVEEAHIIRCEAR